MGYRVRIFGWWMLKWRVSVSNVYTNNLLTVNAPERLVTLLEVYHPQMQERIYVNDDVVAVEVFGKKWLGFPFEYTLPNDEDQVASAGTITINNIGGVLLNGGDGRELTLSEWLDEADGGRGVRIRLMQTLLSDPHPEIDIDFELSGISVTREKISGQIKVGTNSLNSHAVGLFFTPETAPGIF